MTKVAQPDRSCPEQTTRLAGAPRGPRKREERSDALLDAAAALFVEKGVAATSIDDIAERAHVAKGTFYHYFQDRAAMLEGLRARYCRHFADVADAAIGACPPNDLRAQLDAWIGTVVREYIVSYALHDAIFHDPAICHRCVMSDEPIVQSLVTLVGKGESAGIWAVRDPGAAAVCMFHAVHGLVDEVIATDAAKDTIAPLLSDMFWNMLRPA